MMPIVQCLGQLMILALVPLSGLAFLQYLEKLGFLEEETKLILAGITIGTILSSVSYLLSKVLIYFS